MKGNAMKHVPQNIYFQAKHTAPSEGSVGEDGGLVTCQQQPRV